MGADEDGDAAGDGATRIEGGAAADEPAGERVSLEALGALKVPLTDLIKVRLRRDGDGGKIGRYVVLRLLGEGGMGSVFAAYDGELDRKVAIKLLRADSISGPFDRSWLLGEAKAMARLSHPNVVQIYDVGEVDDHVFIAMEMVQGVTLRSWLKGARRRWEEVVRVFVEAGRGLEAVHNAELVHRDFKPHNVIVGDDGRVRVLDFGLAHFGASGAADPSLSVSSGSSRTIVGTPAYMAPEQLLGVDVDARSDIFAFCVALYEAAFGVRPFVGKDLRSIVAAITDGELQPPPAESRVPARARRAILRGLRAVPSERWGTMGELLAVLDQNPWRRRALALVVAATVAVVALGWSLQRQRALEAEREATRCGDGAPLVAAVYDVGRREAVAAAFAATRRPFAADASAAVQRRLDAYADELVAAYRGTCEEHRGGGLTDNLYERAQICLDADLLALGALTGVFAEADAKVVEDAVKALGSLPRIDACRDRAALALQVRPPDDPEVAAAARGLREALAGRHAALIAGKVAECVGDLAPLHDQIRALGYAPLVAEAASARGRCEELVGEFEAAERHFLEAMSEAIASDHAPVAAEAATRLIRVIGHRRGLLAEARRWGLLAAAMVRRRGDLPEEVARVESSLAGVDLLEGRPEEALGRYDRALAGFEAAFGRSHYETLAILNNRGAALHALGRHAELRANLEDAAARTRELLGAHHPSLSTILSNLGNSLLRDGDTAAAIAAQRDAIALQEELLGAEHVDLSTLLANLAEALSYAGEFDEAEATFERALRVREVALGDDHRSTADALLNLGNFYLVWREDPARGRPLLERALAIYRRHLPADHPRIGTTLALIGRADVLMGKRAAGLAGLEAALTIVRQGKGLAEDDAELRFFLAQALWERPKERARARVLAEAAATGYRAAGPLHARHLAEVEAWLAARPSI
ncbi:MAG: serine/threonine-protein kinase [Nannocystaceae bacterium]